MLTAFTGQLTRELDYKLIDKYTYPNMKHIIKTLIKYTINNKHKDIIRSQDLILNNNLIDNIYF